MKQLIIGGYNDALQKFIAEYNTLGGGGGWSALASIGKQVVSTPGTFSNFAVELSAAPGGGGSYTITLLNVTQGTSLAVTITDPDTMGINTGTLAAVAGDIIQLKSTFSSPSATPTARWSIIFDGNNPNESLILGMSSSLSSATRYTPLMHGGNSIATSESQAYQIIPTSGKIKNLFVSLSADPGTAPDAYRFTLRVNGANSNDGEGNPLQVTIVADNTTGNDIVHEIPVSPGDYVDLMIEPLETPSATPTVSFGLTFVADIDGESLLLGTSSDTPTIGTSEYCNIVSTFWYVVWSATEASFYQGGQAGITLKKFYAMLEGSPGEGKTYQLDIRATSGGGDTGITVSISDLATTGNDTVHTYNMGNYDDLAIECATTEGATARQVYWGLVCYIPTPIVALYLAQTLREITLLTSCSGQTQRSLKNLTFYTGQAKRAITALADYSGQGRRAVLKIASFIGQGRRKITSLAQYAAQTLRIVLVGFPAEFIAQTVRRVKSAASYQGQTKRITTIAASYIGQTFRSVTKLAQYSAQTLRIIKGFAAYAGQTRRAVGKLASYSAQGYRIVTAGASCIGQALRRVSSLATYMGQARRKVVTLALYRGQALRRLTSLAFYSGQGKRFVKALASYQAQTRRAIGRMGFYIAQSYRKVKAEAVYYAQTKRTIERAAAYIGQGLRRITFPASFAGQSFRKVISLTIYSGQTRRGIKSIAEYIAQTLRRLFTPDRKGRPFPRSIPSFFRRNLQDVDRKGEEGVSRGNIQSSRRQNIQDTRR